MSADWSKHVLRCAGAVLCVCLAGGVVRVSLALSDALAALAALPAGILEQAAGARADLQSELRTLRMATIATMDAMRRDVRGEVSAAIVIADGRLAAIQDAVDAQVSGLRLDIQDQLDALNRSVAEFAAVRRDLKPGLDALG